VPWRSELSSFSRLLVAEPTALVSDSFTGQSIGTVRRPEWLTSDTVLVIVFISSN